MPLDKDLIAKAIDKALEEVLEIQDKAESTDEIMPDLKTDDNKERLESTEPEVDIEVKVEEDVNVTDINEKVEEILEEEVEKESNFNFFGLDISIVKNGDSFDVTMKKDDKEKHETVDNLEFSTLAGVVETFFTELVLDEDEETNDEDKDSTFEADETVKTGDVLSEEVGKDEKDEEDEEGEEGLKASLASLRVTYKDKINEYFEHGILAKQIALSYVKDKIVTNTVGELLALNKEKEETILAKKELLQKTSQKYIMASKMNKKYEKAVSIIASAISDMQKNLSEDKLNKNVAEKAINKYNAIISNIVNCKKPETIEKELEKITLVKNAIIASMQKQEKMKLIMATNNVNKNKINEGMSGLKANRNILNNDGWINNKSILANRYDGIEEMSSELLRIAGITE